jgi:hypothetical protein
MRAETRNFPTTGSKKRSLNQVTGQSENLDSEPLLSTKRVKLDPFAMRSKANAAASKTTLQ